MIREAFFSDQTSAYLNPVEPDVNQRITIGLRAHKGDSVSAYFCTDGVRIPMYYIESKGSFSHYAVTYQLTDRPISYYFEIHEGPEMVFYDKRGVSDSIRPEYGFTLMPGFKVPEWSKGAVMYQILVDRFARGDESNDVLDGEYYYIDRHVKRIEDWNTPPAIFDVGNFYGGDLAGVEEKFGYLRSLGVEAVYFNPIFVSPSNHKYDAQDYDYIDPHYGRIINDGGEVLKEGESDNTKATKYISRVTDPVNLEASNEFFADFVKKAHEHGIKVIIDGVFNHCGSFHKWMDREGIYKKSGQYENGAFWLSKSPYREYFDFAKDSSWPENKDYDGWWGHDTLPKLNYEGSEELCEKILEIGRKWVSPPYNADGWRLDVAADLGHTPGYNHSFWKRFRQAVKDANPQAVILAEHYGDASSWLKGDEWDTIMNYDAFMDPVSYFLTGMEKHSDIFDESALGDGPRFEGAMSHEMTRFMTPSLHSAMIQLSNHDHSRFLTRTNHVVGRVADHGSEAAGEGVDYAVFKQGVLMQMTWPGAPTLYYGDEAGVVGFTDPDSRRTYPWDNPNERLIDFYRDCISMHKNSRAIRLGSFMFIESGMGYVCYARFNENEKIVVAINTGEESRELYLPVWKAEVPLSCEMTRIMLTNTTGYSIFPQTFNVIGGNLNITLEPKSGSVYKVSL